MNKLLRGGGALCAGVFSLGLTTSVEALPTYNAFSTFVGCNFIDVGCLASPLVPEDSSTTIDGSTASSSLNGKISISGIDINDNPSTLTVAYDGASQVSAGGVLKARSSLIIENGFFNEQNDPFVTDTDVNTDPNGVPDGLLFVSQTSLTDTLSVQGAGNLSSIVLSINLDGELSRINPVSVAGTVLLLQGNNLLFNGGFGSINETLHTNQLQVVNGIVDLDLSLQTASVHLLDFFENPFFNGFDIGSSADFFNTFTIGSIAGFDANGNPVDVVSATDSTGFQFTTVRVGSNNVPEPGTLALFCMGLLGFRFIRYRKQVLN